MGDTGVIIFSIVFSIMIVFLLLNTPQAVAQTSPFVKFDQLKIIAEHNDVITLFDTNISGPTVVVSVESYSLAGAGGTQTAQKNVTLEEIGVGSHLYRKMVKFTTGTPGTYDIAVVNNGSVKVIHLSKSDIADITSGTGTQSYGTIRLDNSNAPCTDDVDKDAVCDSWESNTSSLTINYPTTGTYSTQCLESQGFLDDKFDIFTPCSGTDKRDIYVEIDYMIGHRPNEESLKKVVRAFYDAPATNQASAGIRLHIQIDDVNATSIFHKKIQSPPNTPPYDECTTFPGVPSGQQRGFDQLKAKFFATSTTWKQKKQVFHYALFVHNQCSGSTSGNAEVFGNDMIISLGSFDGLIGNPEQQAGTFMHELGHNLKLNHGGADTDLTNCKPNYLSVLSYSRQFPDLVSDRALDYSWQILGADPIASPINETPTEQAGITNYIHNPQEKIIWGPTTPIPLPPTADVCINWDQDQTLCETTQPLSPSMNLNLISSGSQNVCDGVGASFSGYNDWENINLNSKGMGTWQDGRSAGAGPQVAVWEMGAVARSNLMPSFFCPSIQQIAAVIPSGASDEAIRGHLSNYRACAAGVGESNKTVIACSNYLAIAKSRELDSASFDLNPTKFQNFSISQDVVDVCKTYFQETIPTESLFLGNGSETIATYINVPRHSSENVDGIINTFETIDAYSEITAEDVKTLRLSRLDSIEMYVKSLDETDFIGVKGQQNSQQNTLDYTSQSLTAIRAAINHDDMELALKKVIDLNYTGRIIEGKKLSDLHEGIYDVTRSYSYALGGYVIPEFGTVATLILVVSIVSIIIITAKTRNSLFKIQVPRTN